MTQIAFDTLAYAKKLKAAGLDSRIAEVFKLKCRWTC